MNTNSIEQQNIVLPTQSQLSDYAQDVYKLMNDKGFWNEGERNIRQSLSLMICELSELVEADRAGEWAKVEQYKQEPTVQLETGFSVSRFKNCLKGSVECELADFVIRIFDFFGGYSLEFYKYEHVVNNFFDDLSDFSGAILDLKKLVTKADDDYLYIIRSERSPKSTRHQLSRAVYAAYIFADHYKIDLDFFIQEKMKYNATRPPKHGKKY